MTEQPKEYIISGDQAEEYAKLYAEANTADFAKMTKVHRVANNFLKQIHSRPISTPLEGAAPESLGWMRPLCFGNREAICDTRCIWGIRKRCIEYQRNPKQGREP